MILTGPTSSSDVFYHVNYSATKLASENATRVTVTLSLYAAVNVRAIMNYRATVGTLTQSSSKDLMVTAEPAAFCTLPNMLIFHDEGGKADASVSVTATFGSRQVNFSCKLPLDRIDRTSRFTSIADAVAGEQCKYSFCRQSLEFTHSVTLRVGMYEKTQKVDVFEGAYEMYASIALPLEEVARGLPYEAQREATLSLSSYWGDKLVGTDTRTFTVTIPVCEETLPSITATLAPEALEGFEGLYLQGKTPVRVTLEGEAKYGALVEYCEAIFEGKTYVGPTRLDAPTAAGEVPVTLRVVDSRGYVREVVRILSVHPYSAPRLLPADGYEQVSATRGEGDTPLALALRAAVSPITVEGEAKNTYTLQYRMRAMTESAFGEWVTLAKNAPFVGEAEGVSLSRLQSYAVELSCIDRIGERATLTLYISTEEVSFHLRAGGMGAAFGKYAEEERVLEIAPDWTLRLHGNLDDSVTLTDTAAYATDADAPYCRVQLIGGKSVRVELSLPFEGTAPQTLAQELLDERALPTRTVLALCPCTDGAIACVSLDTAGTLTLLALYGAGGAHTLHARLEYDAR